MLGREGLKNIFVPCKTIFPPLKFGSANRPAVIGRSQIWLSEKQPAKGDRNIGLRKMFVSHELPWLSGAVICWCRWSTDDSSTEYGVRITAWMILMPLNPSWIVWIFAWALLFLIAFCRWSPLSANLLLLCTELAHILGAVPLLRYYCNSVYPTSLCPL